MYRNYETLISGHRCFSSYPMLIVSCVWCVSVKAYMHLTAIYTSVFGSVFDIYVFVALFPYTYI